MKFPRLITEISNAQWAISGDAFSGMLSIIDGDETSDRSVFHALEEYQKEAMTGALGEPVDGTSLTRIKGNIGFIDIDGPIVHRSNGVAKVSGLTSVQGLIREFKALEENTDVTEIVLLLDTPGGVVKGTSEFVDMVAGCDKRVTAYVWGTAASAGYWIAASADNIVSSDTGVVGSIGVVLTYDLNSKTGLGKIISSQTKKKQMSFESEKGRKSAQKLVDDLADVFINSVASGRGVSAETVQKKYGQGDIFVAAEAKKRGMIDSISTLDSLIDELMDKDTSDESYESLDIEKIDSQKQAATNSAAKIKGELPMTLKELMAEHPNIREEVEAIKNDAYQSGADSVQAKIDKTIPFFENKNYPPSVAKLCVEVLKGKYTPDALAATVTVLDAQKEHEKITAAINDEKEIGQTPAQVPDALSADGIVRTEADYQAMIAEIQPDA